MSLERLQRLAEQFLSVPPSEFADLADACRDLAINQLDVRYMVLGECLRLSWAFWGEGEGAGVSADFYRTLARIWSDYLPGVLRAAEAEGTAVALALLEELRTWAGTDPVGYRVVGGRSTDPHPRPRPDE